MIRRKSNKPKGHGPHPTARRVGLVLSWCALSSLACHRPADEHEDPIRVPVHCVPAARGTIDVTETLRGRVAAPPGGDLPVGSSRVDLQACKLEYSIVSPK